MKLNIISHKCSCAIKKINIFFQAINLLHYFKYFYCNLPSFQKVPLNLFKNPACNKQETLEQFKERYLYEYACNSHVNAYRYCTVSTHLFVTITEHFLSQDDS